ERTCARVQHAAPSLRTRTWSAWSRGVASWSKNGVTWRIPSGIPLEWKYKVPSWLRTMISRLALGNPCHPGTVTDSVRKFGRCARTSKVTSHRSSTTMVSSVSWARGTRFWICSAARKLYSRKVRRRGTALLVKDSGSKRCGGLQLLPSPALRGSRACIGKAGPETSQAAQEVHGPKAAWSSCLEIVKNGTGPQPSAPLPE
ncbi:hypothetical protein C8R45DRAFT_1172596, partial [Mycena sanguinolenta]